MKVMQGNLAFRLHLLKLAHRPRMWNEGVTMLHLGTGSGLRIRFLVMLGLMALRALTGASALAAVLIWAAKDAYYVEIPPQLDLHLALQLQRQAAFVRLMLHSVMCST